MAKTRMGRPPKGAGKTLGAVMTVRMLKSERAAIGRAAKAAGKGASEWIREVLMSVAVPAKMDQGNNEKRKAEDSNPIGGDAPIPRDVKPR
jgi:hypothetical protein